MKFKHANGEYDTGNIMEHEARRFNDYVYYLRNQMESIVNPRKCINLDRDTIDKRIILMSEKIQCDMNLSEEQVNFLLALPPVKNF